MTRKENSITTIIKFALLIVANCLVILLGILSICLWIDVDSHNEKWSHPGFISYKANLTLNQDITVVNSGKPDESITLKKDTMIICENISERGVLYSEDHDSVHYHEYIPFDYFVESEELKETSDSRQNKIKAIEQVATIKKICFSAVYLAIAIPVTIILFMKKKYRTTLVINFILMFVALFISWFVYLFASGRELRKGDIRILLFIILGIGTLFSTGIAKVKRVMENIRLTQDKSMFNFTKKRQG